MEGKSKKPLKENREKQKDFSYIEALLDKYPYAYTIEEIMDEEFGEMYSVEKEELTHEFYEYIRQIAEKKEIERIKSWEESIKEIKHKEKEEKINLFNKYKNLLTDKNIANEKVFLIEKEPIKAKNWAYCVDAYARKLTEEYFIKINKTPSKKEYLNILTEIKKYYYDNKKKPKLEENSNLGTNNNKENDNDDNNDNNDNNDDIENDGEINNSF